MAALANFKHGKYKKVLIKTLSKPTIFINALFHLVLNTNDMALRSIPLGPEVNVTPSYTTSSVYLISLLFFSMYMSLPKHKCQKDLLQVL